MADHAEEDEMEFGLTVDGGDLNRSGTQPARHGVSLESYLSTEAQSLSDPSDRTILIEGVPESHEEDVENFLENRRKGGGRMESFKRDNTNTTNMIAVFAHREAAKNMLRLGSLKVAGVTMKISSQTSMQMPSFTEKQSGFDRLREIRPATRSTSSVGPESDLVSFGESVSDQSLRTIVIKGVPDKYRNPLKDFLANPENGGGRIVSFDPDPTNSRNMIAVFAHQRAAESMLGKGTVEIIGVTMTICPPGSHDTQDVTSDTVKVFNIPPYIKEDMLKMYLELKKRSGGGKIKDFQMNSVKRTALVRFENAADAAEVSNRGNHQLSGGFFDVVLLESDAANGSGGGCRAIRVAGIDRHRMGDDFVSMYFENMSPDDEVTDLFFDQDFAVVTYASPEAVKRVLSIERHVLSDVELHVDAMIPRSPPPVYAGETEKNRLIVKGLPFGITLIKLSEFVEPEAGCGVTGWVLGSKKNSAMLEFNGEPDYAALRRLVSSVPFSGRMLGIQRVPLATCIQVDGLSEKSSDKSVVAYFEGKASVSRGSVQFTRTTKTSMILKFPKHTAVVSILSQQHHLDGQPLRLSPFSKELGCALPEKLSNDPPDNWIPKSTQVVVGSEQLESIQHSPGIRDRTEQMLKKANCVITWPSGADGAVKLEQIGKRGGETEDQEWPELCTSVFESLLVDIVTRKLAVTPEVFRQLKTGGVDGKTSEVYVKFDEGSSEIQFSGLREEVETFEKKLKVLMDEVEKQLEEEEERKRRKVEVLTVLKSPQIRYLQQCGLADEVRKRYAKVTLRADDQKVELEGAEDLLTDAKLFIYDSINQVERRFVDMSQDLTQLITTEPTKTYVSDYLKENKIMAIIEEPQAGRNGVTVHAIGEDLKKASAFLTTEFVSVELRLNDAGRHTMRTPDWQMLEESLKRDHRYFCLRSSSDTLFVSCRKDLADVISKTIREVFEKHVTIEHFVGMRSLDVQLVTTFKKSEVAAVAKKLGESAVDGKLKEVLVHGDTSGFALKGSREEIEAAKKQLGELVKSVTEAKQVISRPGVVSLHEDPKWNEFVDSVEQKHKVIVKTTVNNPYVTSTDVKYGPRHQMTINGHSIVIVLGDIFDIQEGGALVHPTNSRLELSHGMGLEIVKIGGDVIKEQCADHIASVGILSPGKIFVSEAGQMLCDNIIHVVESTTFDDQAVAVFQSAVKSILEEALKRRFQFVAFPLSFGAAFRKGLLFATTKEFFERAESTGLKSVQFVGDDVVQLKVLEGQLKDYERSLTSTGVPGSSPASAQPTPPAPTDLAVTTKEGIVVKLYKGTICALQVDVIVNSTAKNLALNHSGVSKAISTQAGPELQKECQLSAPTGLAHYGDILSTKPYNLPCKAIYHGAALQWDSGAGPAEKVLQTFISNALNEAHKQKMASIAIPAIGSGTLKVPHDVVVKVLFDEIFKFSKSHPGTSLQTIYTVAYEQNQPSVAAFEKKFVALQPVPSTSPLQRQVGQTKALRIYNEKMTISINALSQSAAQSVQTETTKFIADATKQRPRDIPTKTLTDEQLERIDYLQVVHRVRITVSNGNINVDGLKEDVQCSVDKIKFIIRDS